MSDFRVVKKSQIDGDFEGFDDEVLIKLMDGTYWVQDEYKYWYHYAYCPTVLIIQKGGRLFIQIEGQSEIVPVRQIGGVIQSKIDGEFRGWDGETIYKLLNGQVWQQSHYKYEYKYAYRPDALIYNPGGGHIILVEGTSARVRRIE
jgi:hypothetical protein